MKGMGEFDHGWNEMWGQGIFKVEEGPAYFSWEYVAGQDRFEEKRYLKGQAFWKEGSG